MPMKRFLLLLLFLDAGGLADVHAGPVWLPRIFGDNMVLQRGVNTPVWGQAIPGSRVKVEIAGVQATAVTDGEGRWMARLPAMPAGGPYELKATGRSLSSFGMSCLAMSGWPPANPTWSSTSRRRATPRRRLPARRQTAGEW